MRITDVRVTALEAPVPEGSRNRCGAGMKFSRTSSFVEVMTDEGITGLGTCLGNAPNTLKAIIEDSLAPSLCGKDPFNIEGLWQEMYAGRVMSQQGPRSLGVAAMSGLDIALWDIKGKALGVPIYQLLGGACRDRVRAYASSIYWQAPEAAASKARQYVDQGFTGVKIKIGRDMQSDIANIAAIREAVGDGVDLFVDANTCYAPKLAIQMARELERYKVFWFEEPIPFDDLEGHKLLTNSTTVRIATGENMFTRAGFRDFINQRAVDIVQPDPARCGGITEAKKIATAAGANGLLFAPHSFGDAVCLLAALHVIASTPEAFNIEVDVTHNPLRSELGGKMVEVDNGFMELPNKPGLGVELTDEMREKYPYRGGVTLTPSAVPALGLAHENLPDRAYSQR